MFSLDFNHPLTWISTLPLAHHVDAAIGIAREAEGVSREGRSEVDGHDHKMAGRPSVLVDAGARSRGGDTRVWRVERGEHARGALLGRDVDEGLGVAVFAGAGQGVALRVFLLDEHLLRLGLRGFGGRALGGALDLNLRVNM